MKVISTTALYAIFLCAFALPVVQAQPATSRPVNRDELRVCMNSEGELTGRRQALEARGKRFGEESAAIRAEATELATEQQALRERQAPMDRFERKARAHNLRVKAAQSSAEGFRLELDSLNQTLLDYNARCGLISFSGEDQEAILTEREAAKK